MSTRNEIKAQLRENTKEAFRLIGKKASPGVGYTVSALTNMTEGRLSAQSLAMFFRKNQSYIKDRASSNTINEYWWDIEVERTTKKEKVHRTYVNVDDPNDTIDFEREVTLYYINKVSIDR